jgi:diguanylate cyclase (GGDEF)-like protein/PAS domain S-box-containing protein
MIKPFETDALLIKLASALHRSDLKSARRGPRADLTLREIEIVGLTASGLATKPLAECLGVSPNTVRNHVASILHKLEAHSKFEAVAIALREGIIEFDTTGRREPSGRRHDDDLDRLIDEAHAIACIGGWKWDIASDALRWTDEHYQIFGLDRSSFTPTMANCLDLIHEDDLHRVRSSLDETIMMATSCSFAARIRRPDDEVRWIESVGVPSIVDGEVIEVVGIVLDVTDREVSIVNLRDSEARYKTIVDTAAEGIWAVDADGITTFANQRIADLFGLPLVEILGVPISAFMDDRGRARFAEDLDCRRDGEEGSFDFRWVLPDARELWTMLSTSPLYDADGRYSGAVAMVTDITDRRRAETALQISQDELAQGALHDSLTGLANRSLFRDRSQLLLTRRDSTVAVMLLDLDGFKAITDRLGHSAGDAVLVEVAGRLTRAVRQADTVARLDGDKFAVLVQSVTDTKAAEAARRLIEALELPIILDGRSVLARASIGVAVGCAGSCLDELLADAEAARSAAKWSGGNRFQMCTQEIKANATRRRTLEDDVRDVRLGSDMTLHYQPIVNLHDGELVGLEALLRWNHSELGTIPPDEFIAIAERTGEILPIGRWVVEEACRQARLWQQHYPPAARLTMSVNVSARQLADPAIVADVSHALAVSGLDPARLTLEITETMIMSDESDAAERLRLLKDLGVRISVDDFGTGYSSLAHLDRFPVDELKIDRTFVDRLGSESRDSLVALGVVRLAHSLQLDVVAEGIETEAQLIELRRAGCTFGQGYYFSRPMDPDSLGKLFDQPTRSVLPAPTSVVLVVDDDDTVRRSMSRLLAEEGYEVLQAATGAETIRIAHENRIDAVVLDICLPDVDGVRLCRQLEDQSRGDLPVLCVSGTAIAVDDRVQALNSGAEAYLTKPVASEELIATLGAMLRRGRPMAARLAGRFEPWN